MVGVEEKQKGFFTSFCIKWVKKGSYVGFRKTVCYGKKVKHLTRYIINTLLKSLRKQPTFGDVTTGFATSKQGVLSGAKVGAVIKRPCYARYTTDSSERPVIYIPTKNHPKQPPVCCHQFALAACHLRIKRTIVLFFSLSPTANCPCKCDGKSKMLE